MTANLPDADEYRSHELMHLPPAPRRSRDREDFLIRKENVLNIHVEQVPLQSSQHPNIRLSFYHS